MPDLSATTPRPKPSALKDTCVIKPLYPGLYGWQIAYQLGNGSVAFCSCFREAWDRHFDYLQRKFAGNPARAFLKFAWHINPATLKAFFPGCNVAAREPQIIDGKEFFFSNHGLKAPELDEKFWKSPEQIFQFKESICEVCTGRVPKHYYCHKMYGGPFAQVYGAWVGAELIRQGYFEWSNLVDVSIRRKLWNGAENKIRTIVGVPKIGEKFASETMLFKTIAFLLRGHEVIHHYRADWLAHQELDIFVPSLKLAIEYQGEQHFNPVEAWGGEDGLQETRQRDNEKKLKCECAGIKLIYFDYTMELTEKFVARQLKSVCQIPDEEVARKLV